MRNLEGRFVYRGLQGTAKEDSGNGASLCKWLCEGNLEGGLLLGTLKDIQRRLWKLASFFVGAPLGDQGGDAALPGNLTER
jgi:hypothetical protein